MAEPGPVGGGEQSFSGDEKELLQLRDRVRELEAELVPLRALHRARVEELAKAAEFLGRPELAANVRAVGADVVAFWRAFPIDLAGT